MKSIFAVIFALLVGIATSCTKEKPPTPTPTPEVTPPSIFEVQWATRIDPTRDIISGENTQLYKDWVLIGGDTHEVPTVYAYDKNTGEHIWTFIGSEMQNSGPIQMFVRQDYLLAASSHEVFALDLRTQTLAWSDDISKGGQHWLDDIYVAKNDKLYLDLYYDFRATNQRFSMREYNIQSGEFKEVFAITEDKDGKEYDASLPEVWFNPELGKDILIINLYPNANDGPATGTQFLAGIDPDTKEELWRIKLGDQFPSNGLHPVLIKDNKAITTCNGYMMQIDLTTQEILWQTKFPDVLAGWLYTQHFIHEDRIYTNLAGLDVACLDFNSGEVLWKNKSGGGNCADYMHFYEKENLLVFACFGYGQVIALDGDTGELVAQSGKYDNSIYYRDAVYDEETDYFYSGTFKHAVAFTLRRPE